MVDDDIVEKIYRQYFDLFLYIGHNRFHFDPETIKDKIQETFKNIWKNRHRINNNDEKSMRCYAIRVFRNTCINHLKRPNLFIEYDDSDKTNNPDNPANMVDVTANPLFEILITEEKRLQEKAISRLPVKYREIVRLSLEGMKRKNIAEKLNIKETSIHNLKFRGLKKYETIINRLDPLRKS